MVKEFFYKHYGFCPICEKEVTFQSNNSWLRDHLLCSACGSIPRERAITQIISQYYPQYSSLKIHESSPCGRGLSQKLSKFDGYSMSHFFPEVDGGRIDPLTGFRCENLEKLTFPDNYFDLFVTQDVMEHIFNPELAFREIARVLKPGGAHIFTVPIVNKNNPSYRRAQLNSDGSVSYHAEAQYHGNPVDNSGSLVTVDWGYDIADFIMKEAGTPSIICYIDDIDKGIRAEYIEVIVQKKY